MSIEREGQTYGAPQLETHISARTRTRSLQTQVPSAFQLTRARKEELLLVVRGQHDNTRWRQRAARRGHASERVHQVVTKFIANNVACTNLNLPWQQQSCIIPTAANGRANPPKCLHKSRRHGSALTTIKQQKRVKNNSDKAKV